MRNAHDWEIIASRDPYYGVLTSEEFRSDKLDEEARKRFYQSGHALIAHILDLMEARTDWRPRPGRALDVGCGVGRLAYAMSRHMKQVIGYDISDTMVSITSESAPPNVEATTVFPEGPFDWINSFIVFQHIPPVEGMALLDRCLAAASPRACLSLHFSCWRDGPGPSAAPQKRLRAWLKRRHARSGRGPNQPLIQMYDYDLGEILKRLMLAGFSSPALRHEQHDMHHGVWVFAHRD